MILATSTGLRTLHSLNSGIAGPPTSSLHALAARLSRYVRAHFSLHHAGNWPLFLALISSLNASRSRFASRSSCSA